MIRPATAHVHPRRLQFLGTFSRVALQDLRNGVGVLVFAAVRGLPQSFNLFQFFAPQFLDIFVECQSNPSGAER